MILSEKLGALASEKWHNGKVGFKKIETEEELIYAVFECKLRADQVEFVNPASFSIGRAYISPQNNYPCIILDAEGEKIGFINLCKWPGGTDALSWSYYIDEKYQCRGYGRSAAELVLSIFGEIAPDMMVKVSTEQANVRAQKLYLSLGLRRLDEMDGDDLVFGK